MKKLLLLLYLIAFTSSCDLDKSYEKGWKNDRDDVNIINKAWDQYLNKAIKVYDTNTRAS